MILGELVKPFSTAARSVQVERDINNPDVLSRYQVTDKGIHIIQRLISSLNGEPGSSWSITGPYGMGKSSFLNFLLAVLGPANDTETRLARTMLHHRDPNLGQQLKAALQSNRLARDGFLRVPITASYEAINRSLTKGLRGSLLRIKDSKKTRTGGLDGLLAAVNSMAEGDRLSASQVVGMFQEAERILNTPIAIAIDEFGKNLEFMARHPDAGDLYALQLLAESRGFYIWVCQHQAFEEYSAGLSTAQIQEWVKIQGRFEDIAFFEPRHQMLQFVRDSLVRCDSNAERAIQRWAKSFMGGLAEVALPEINAWDASHLAALYPLHPLTALLLPELCLRFAQNDRTLFSFLCGGAPHALPAFLSAHTVDLESVRLVSFGPELLYDYFLSSVSGYLMMRPESQRLIEVQEMVYGARELESSHQAVVKVIGLLNLVSGPSTFKASENLLRLAFHRPNEIGSLNSRALEKILSDLARKGIVVYRSYADEYRLWEGTDFDIGAAVREQAAIQSTRPLDDMLQQTVPLTPIIASRHSYRTGTLRVFERRWCKLDRITGGTPECSSAEWDGLILYSFGSDELVANLPSRTSDGRPIIMAFGGSEEDIRTLLLEAAATKMVLEVSPELARDGVARKEARFRSKIAERQLRQYLDSAFSPGSAEGRWFFGEMERCLESHRDLSRFLSDVCDEVYFRCPIIRNELINRNRLTSAAAKARRELIEAMMTREAEEMLGMMGAGPEKAIYRTMIQAQGLHQSTDRGLVRFCRPGSDSTYSAAWTAIERMLQDAQEEAVPITHCIDMLRRPPFGMKQGPIPVLLALFLIVESDDVVLYQEGAFVPYLGPEEMELMAKRPEYFSIRLFSHSSERGKVFQACRELLDGGAVTEDDKIRNLSILQVVGPLVQFANGLPVYSRTTRSVSARAQRVRSALLNARDPLDLLFKDLPLAVDLKPFNESKQIPPRLIADFQDRLRAALLELSEAFTRLKNSVSSLLSQSFMRESCEIRSVRMNLGLRARPLTDLCGDRELKSFLAVLADDTFSEESWLAAVATLSVHRPLDSWRDDDLKSFAASIAELARRFVAFETVTAAQTVLIPTGQETAARLISFTQPDGKTISKVWWLEKGDSERLYGQVARLKKRHSEKELQALFVLLGEMLLNQNNTGGTTD